MAESNELASMEMELITLDHFTQPTMFCGFVHKNAGPSA